MRVLFCNWQTEWLEARPHIAFFFLKSWGACAGRLRSDAAVSFLRHGNALGRKLAAGRLFGPSKPFLAGTRDTTPGAYYRGMAEFQGGPWKYPGSLV